MFFSGFAASRFSRILKQFELTPKKAKRKKTEEGGKGRGRSHGGKR